MRNKTSTLQQISPSLLLLFGIFSFEEIFLRPDFSSTFSSELPESTEETITSEIKDVLDNYANIMTESLPQTLPPRRGIDHEIELIPRG